jgi:hypothetical protein
MEAIKEFLGLGRIIEEGNNVVRFIVESISYINMHIVPLFKNYPLQSGKVQDFLDFSLDSLPFTGEAFLLPCGPTGFLRPLS